MAYLRFFSYEKVNTFENKNAIMATEYTERCYITCSTTTQERIARLQQVIEALENQAINAAGNADLNSYSLNDGQIIIRTDYRNPTEIADAIEVYEKILIRLINRCSNTRIFTVRDARSLNIRNGYGSY